MGTLHVRADGRTIENAPEAGQGALARGRWPGGENVGLRGEHLVRPESQENDSGLAPRRKHADLGAPVILVLSVALAVLAVSAIWVIPRTPMTS